VARVLARRRQAQMLPPPFSQVPFAQRMQLVAVAVSASAAVVVVVVVVVAVVRGSRAEADWV
jgi:hypothetical protein